ncbi:hypothetical protein KP509_36G030800 [Ceratopteris richardii]|uniref:Secreted protein n=1 Tax=Ceratopteris richardii TaxID=49495 RepID=A0A8T2QCA5_CERRI|nr:hypothetical protein KP509_36G030800 [Ceratopteris richardii]
MMRQAAMVALLLCWSIQNELTNPPSSRRGRARSQNPHKGSACDNRSIGTVSGYRVASEGAPKGGRCHRFHVRMSLREAGVAIVERDTWLAHGDASHGDGKLQNGFRFVFFCSSLFFLIKGSSALAYSSGL